MSSRYRRIHTKMWGDERFRRLSPPQPNAQSLWIYLLTGPHNTMLPGLFTIGEMALCENLEWELKAFRKAFLEVQNEGMVQADWKSRVVWIPNMPRHNPPTNPNIIIGWKSAFDEIPECMLKYVCLQELKVFMEEFHNAFQEGFLKAFAKDIRKASGMVFEIKEKEKEKEKEQEQEKEKPSRMPSGEYLFEPDKLIELWNRLVVDNQLPLAQVLKTTAARRTKTKNRLEEIPDLSKWEEIILFVGTDPFFCGKNDRGWRADYDYITRSQDVPIKILERSAQRSVDEKRKAKLEPTPF